MTKLEQYAIQQKIKAVNGVIKGYDCNFSYHFDKETELVTFEVRRQTGDLFTDLFEIFSMTFRPQLVETEGEIEGQDYQLNLIWLEDETKNFWLGYQGVIYAPFGGAFDAIKNTTV